MAIIKCPDCNTEISDTAKECKQCGRNKEPGVFLKLILPKLILPILIAIIALGGTILTINSEAQQFREQMNSTSESQIETLQLQADLESVRQFNALVQLSDEARVNAAVLLPKAITELPLA